MRALVRSFFHMHTHEMILQPLLSKILHGNARRGRAQGSWWESAPTCEGRMHI